MYLHAILPCQDHRRKVAIEDILCVPLKISTLNRPRYGVSGRVAYTVFVI